MNSNNHLNFSSCLIPMLPADPNDLPVNYSDPGLCQQNGLLKQSADGKTFYMYIPKGLHHNQSCIVIAMPKKLSAIDFLKEKSIADFAYQRQVFIALIPYYEELNLMERADFINAAAKEVLQRKYYVVMQDNLYLMGFGEAALDAQLSAAKESDIWSGLAVIGDTAKSDIDFSDYYSGLQMPVWMVGKHEPKLREFWLKRNNLKDSFFEDCSGTIIYDEHGFNDFSEEEQIAQLRITRDDIEINEIWDYLKTMRRHRCHTKKILKHYSDPVLCGASYHSFEIDGIMREWYEYLPKKLDVESSSSYPLVFVMHGRGGNAESFFDITDMYKVADKYGFACVFPTADFYQQKEGFVKTVRLWNGCCSSINFIRAMYKDICRRLNIDKAKVFAFGQSSGGYMSSRCIFEASDIFSGAAVLSGFAVPGADPKIFDCPLEIVPEKITAPMLLMVGDEDKIVRPLETAGDPASPYGKYISLLIGKMGLNNEGCRRSFKREAPFSWQSWFNENGKEMLRLGIVDKMPHANYPRQSEIAWEFFEGIINS